MLEDKCPMDFAEAVFAVENCMYDGKLDHASYIAELNRIAIGIEHMANSPAYQTGSDVGNIIVNIPKDYIGYSK